jgi:hypothetical protein
VNRDRTSKELERRYQEAVYSTRQEIKTPQEYEQMLTVIAHFMQFMTESRILRNAVKRLTNEKKNVKLDYEISEQSKVLLDRLKLDSTKLERIARRNGVPIVINDSLTGRIPDEHRFALILHSVRVFLEQDEQSVSLIPEQLGNLRVMVWSLRSQGVSERTLRPFTDPYTPLQNDFAQKLRQNNLYKNYLRLNDYNILEDVRQFIYQEMSDQSKQMVFLMVDNDDLIDFSHTKQYDRNEIESAKARQIEYYGNILRFHNYIVDDLENTPVYVKVGRWLFNNFGSTFVSVLLILAVYYTLIWLGVPIDSDRIIDLLK